MSRTPEPPAEAVAQDAHWAKKLARLRARSLPQVHLQLWQDPDLREKYEQAKRTAEQAARFAEAAPDRGELADEAREAATVLERAEKDLADASETLTFRALPGDTFERLLKEHPPGEDAESTADWDEETFPAALIAAACTDPMTEEDAATLLGEWGMADRVDLFQAALAAQNIRRSDWGKGSGPTRS
ncbi:hypothetical protein [Streptomyces sp. NPDC001404]|uniref:hypothetical protein n=1 Tax=Streptomyces sp. NPDC001404 TaxID=3364571 RepID=UPI00367513C9